MSLGRMRTCTSVGEQSSADAHSLKWKPPSENSIDFRISLRFPPLADEPGEADYHAKPEILLNTWLGGKQYEYFDSLTIDQDEWERSVVPTSTH